MLPSWISDLVDSAAQVTAVIDNKPVDEFSRVNCPHCGKRCRVPHGYDIKRARCPRCDKRISEKPESVKPVPVAQPAAPKSQSQPAPPPSPSGKLVDIYRPKCLADLAGQPWAHEVLTGFLANPSPSAFIFAGPTGTGKTSAALALAAELGVAVDWCECGGLHQISSGEQDGATVRDTMRGLRCRPMFGNGWRVLVVNEADCMTANAAVTWLDALEDIPPQSVIVFTTNDPQRIPRRLRDRCEEVAFVGGALVMRPAMESLARKVWAEQVGGALPCPDLDTFGSWAVDGEASFRRLLQLMEPHVRAAKSGRSMPASPPVAEPAKPARKGRGAA